MRTAIRAAAYLPLVAVPLPVLAADEWALLSREGGCHPVQSLKRRLTDLPDVRDPEAFQAYLHSKGWSFSRKSHTVTSGKAVEFVVESQGLALVFVTRELCGAQSR